MEQYSSLCVSAVVLILGGFDIVEVDVQDREEVDSGENTLKHVTSWMTCRWSECAPKTP